MFVCNKVCRLLQLALDVTVNCLRVFQVCIFNIGLAGVGINTCPRLIGSCLDLARPTRDRILVAFNAGCLQTHLASRQDKRVI